MEGKNVTDEYTEDTQLEQIHIYDKGSALFATCSEQYIKQQVLVQSSHSGLLWCCAKLLSLKSPKYTDGWIDVDWTPHRSQANSPQSGQVRLLLSGNLWLSHTFLRWNKHAPPTIQDCVSWTGSLFYRSEPWLRWDRTQSQSVRTLSSSHTFRSAS